MMEPLKKTFKRIWIFLIIGVGFLQILGHVTNIPSLSNLGRTLAASPLPLVFTSYKGIETFGYRYEVEAIDYNGQYYRAELTSKIHQESSDSLPYRHMVVIALTHGPAFRTAAELRMFNAVIRHNFCIGQGEAKLLNWPDGMKTITIHYLPKRSEVQSEKTVTSCEAGNE